MRWDRLFKLDGPQQELVMSKFTVLVTAPSVSEQAQKLLRDAGAVAEHALALMLCLAREVPRFDRELRKGV